jgi:hypothetical protein
MNIAELQSLPDQLWRDLVEAYNAYTQASWRFFAEGVDRVAVFRDALRSPECKIALFLARHLNVDERQKLFPEWVYLSSIAHGGIQVARDMILSLPRQWVVEHIEREAEPLLVASDAKYGFEEYRRLLELYEQLADRELLTRLAHRAEQHPDEDVREAGADFLAKLNQGP